MTITITAEFQKRTTSALKDTQRVQAKYLANPHFEDREAMLAFYEKHVAKLENWLTLPLGSTITL